MGDPFERLWIVVGAGAGSPPDDRGGVRGRILRGARRLLEERGVEEALTLRGVAREAGISAPSVYHHFPDLHAVLEAVIDDAFGDFAVSVWGAVEHVDDPVDRLRLGGQAYLRFAREHPATYRILFTRHRPSALPTVAARAAESHRSTVETIAACGGRPPGADAETDAVLWWVALHGSADLPPANPRFPWPSPEDLVEDILRRVVLYGGAPPTP